MTAAVHLILGPAGSGKTARLVERCREAVRSGPALWLGPTRRHVDAVRVRLFPKEAPYLLTFQEFADEVVRVNDPQARPLAGVQARLLADAIVAELNTGGEVSHFRRAAETRGFGASLFALLGELRRIGVTPGELTRAAFQRGDAGEIGVKDREVTLVYARYEELLRSFHLYDVEGRLWRAVELLRQGLPSPFEKVRAVFVDGFTDFTAPQRETVQLLAERVGELWLTLPDEQGSERAELFTRTREVAMSWGGTAEVGWAESARPTNSTTGDRQLLLFDDEPSPQPLPAGLAHLERQLFRPPRAVVPSADADGLRLIEAPGVLGEARLAAREIKSLLLDGTPPDDVIVAVRDLPGYADLLLEVFTEYGIPVDVEGTEPLTRRPAVAALLRAVRVPDDDWPFAAVTAVLRSGHFRPDWPEVRKDPDVAQHAEVLLRLIGEPRGRDAYRDAVRRWADDPPGGLEDEQAEQSRRDRTHELAVRCRPFLERFFRAWDGYPTRAPLDRHLAWLYRLAARLGVARAAADDPADAAAWQRFETETRQWRDLDRIVHDPPQPLARREFLRRLATLAAETGLARTRRGPGRVRVLSAEMARTLETPYLFVLGLGEGSFPRPTVPSPLFDEADRQAFRQAGVGVACASDMLPDEMLLFYELVTRARRRLTLSYPAVDDRGQPLLPSSFLSQVVECFEPGAVPVTRRRMLLDGLDADTPLSPPELRVQLARSVSEGGRIPSLTLRAGLRDNLAAARELARCRFEEPDFTPFEGLFRHPDVVAAVGQLFGPERVFSPTALEDYVACPFRFFLKHVLRLEELDEPREEIEVTRRGQAFHRALSRLHNDLKAQDVHAPTDELERELHRRLTEAVEEYAARAASPASKTLWQLEGKRLTRAGSRYPAQWQKFLDPWKPVRVAPRPHLFEVDFGLRSDSDAPPAEPLVIRLGDLEVRVSGRIDRVDVADLDEGVGFWVIDYKTGRSAHYTGSDLRDFRRLQLTLYALAVEQVLLAGVPARPLGLAYWLVSDGGPKVVLPGRAALGWFQQPQAWRQVREQLQRWIGTLVEHIRGGKFALRPRSERCTETCEFSQVCRISQARSVEKRWTLPLPTVAPERAAP